MYTAASLAMAHDYDMEQAQMAGLLHDCAKCIPNKEEAEDLQKTKYKDFIYREKQSFSSSCKAGAYIAKEKYQIEDEEILSAIRWHTTGKEAMSELEKIVYIADYIEPGRNKAPRLSWIRKVAFENLDEGMYYILKDSLSYLGNSSKVLDPMTQKAFELL